MFLRTTLLAAVMLLMTDDVAVTSLKLRYKDKSMTQFSPSEYGIPSLEKFNLMAWWGWIKDNFTVIKSIVDGYGVKLEKRKKKAAGGALARFRRIIAARKRRAAARKAAAAAAKNKGAQLPKSLPELIQLGLCGKKIAAMAHKTTFDDEDYQQLVMLTQLDQNVIKNLSLADIGLKDDGDKEVEDAGEEEKSSALDSIMGLDDDDDDVQLKDDNEDAIHNAAVDDVAPVDSEDVKLKDDNEDALKQAAEESKNDNSDDAEVQIKSSKK